MPKSAKSKMQMDAKGYATYLHKIMKKVCSGDGSANITISASAMAIANELILDIEDRISDKAVLCAKFAKKATLAAPHVQTATKLVFPSDMGGMATQEASKSLSKFAEPTAA